MARLSLFLPPLAGDYSGAASTFFNLDCLVVIVDAGCCTRNYVEYDEPRWARQRKMSFSAQLRTVEAVLGDDARIVEQTVEAALELRPALVAIVGTPVPAITGMDLDGLARSVERACGIPAIGIETCGFETYEQGVARAFDALVVRFACGAARHAEGEHPASAHPRVNVLGISPHDFLDEAEVARLLGWLDAAGLEVVCAPGRPGDVLDDLARARTADASLVVAGTGLAAARRLEHAYGVPYLVERPWCAADAAAVAARVASGRMALGESRVAPVAGDAPAAARPTAVQPPVLLVGEPVAMASLRPHVEAALATCGAARPVCCASLFAAEPVLAAVAAGDLPVPASERTLLDWARAHPGFAWLGDPLLERVPGFAEAPHALLPHEAVSSTLFAQLRSELSAAGDGPGGMLEVVLTRLIEAFASA